MLVPFLKASQFTLNTNLKVVYIVAQQAPDKSQVKIDACLVYVTQLYGRLEAYKGAKYCISVIDIKTTKGYDFTRVQKDRPQYCFRTTGISTLKMQTILLYLLQAMLVHAAMAHPAIYFIRHGEKPKDGGDGLSAKGLERAQCLRQVFGAGSGYNIGLIMAQRPKPSLE